MKQLICIASAFFVISGCVTSESQVRQALEKNPQILFDVIEKNPEQFLEAAHRASRAAQEKSNERLGAQMREREQADLKKPKQPKISDDRRLTGSAQSPITIVEYADFQCPACGYAYKSLKELKQKYAGQVQFIYKNMPLDFHKMAYPSAAYFEAIRIQDKDKAYKFYGKLFEGQRGLSEEFLKKAAKEVGADLARLDKDIKSDKVKTRIQEDMDEFQNFGFTGTPVIIVNGVAMEGAQPVSEIERVIAATKK